ncbi:M99 family carboxypeptidase catalytic domain-containing protein [Helicobacter sp. 23-1044]
MRIFALILLCVLCVALNARVIDFDLYKLDFASGALVLAESNDDFAIDFANLNSDSAKDSAKNPKDSANQNPQDSAQDSAKNAKDSANRNLDSTQTPALLILSGIQGDEPGAFNATSILIKHYKITKGNLWVAPNLNQHSILKNNRGIYGDMNRKFAHLNPSDPEFRAIQKIKALILNPQVGSILHLHDGSGFYRESYISPLLNQNRWGNCSIIDQETLFSQGDLNQNITQMINHINDNLLAELHRYRIRNTNTAQGDDEQIKSLTYFATQNHKMAFASEASKALSLDKRVYYHLLAIEGMMRNFGIEFERDFELNLPNIRAKINDKNMDILIAGRVFLPLHNLKAQLNFFPLPKGDVAFKSNTPILWLFKDGARFRIKNGNRGVVVLNPFFIDFDESLESAKFVIDGAEVEAKIGSVVKVKNSFIVKNLPYRVNVIGFNGNGSEVDIEIKRRDLMGKFAIDRANTKFRVEFYKNAESSGDFEENAGDSANLDSVTRAKSAESSGNFGGDSAKKEKSTKEKFAGMIIVDFSD